jgi:hypothetical protein
MSTQEQQYVDAANTVMNSIELRSNDQEEIRMFILKMRPSR